MSRILIFYEKIHQKNSSVRTFDVPRCYWLSSLDLRFNWIYYPRKSILFGWLICASECVYNRINSRFKWNLFNALTLIRWNVWNIVTLDKKVVTLLNNHRINRQLTSDGQMNPNRCDFPNDYIWNENKWKHTKLNDNSNNENRPTLFTSNLWIVFYLISCMSIKKILSFSVILTV